MDYWPPVAIGISVLSSLVGWFRQASSEARAAGAAAAVIDAKMRALNDNEQNMGGELKDAARNLQSVAEQIKVLNAEQSIMNRITASALQGVTEKMGIHERLIAEHGAAIGFMRELLAKKEARA